MTLLRRIWHRLIYGSRTISDRMVGMYFCSDCLYADLDAGHCTVKNRDVRECSTACVWWRSS